jgi:hypothetical protein
MTQTIINLGTGGAALNGRNGSTAGADSNDAQYLDWDGINYVYLPGVLENFMSVPDENALDITGDIDLRARVAFEDWYPGSPTRPIVGKWNSFTNNRSYRLDLNIGGSLLLFWSTDGQTFLSATSSIVTGIDNGQEKWVRATLDVDNGASGNDVRFFLSDDGVTWTQLGTTITQAGATSIYSGSSIAHVGATFNGTNSAAAKFYRAQIFNGIDGTKVLDVDTSVLTTGAATTFIALTGQTVTINRSTSGRKSVAVASPVWLFGTDDFIQVTNNALLNFDANQSFTLVLMLRRWNDQLSFDRYLSKANNLNDGYSMIANNSNSSISTVVDSGPNRVSIAATISNSVASTYVSVIDRTAQTIASYVNNAATATSSISSVGSLTNSLPLRIMRDANGTSYSDAELFGAAVFRRALTAAEVTAVTTYYQNKVS